MTKSPLSLFGFRDALPAIDPVKDRSMPANSANSKSSSGPTHFIEYMGLTIEQANALLTGSGLGTLDCVVRSQTERGVTVWLVIDNLKTAQDLVSRSDARTTRFIPPEEALGFLGINKAYFKVILPNNVTVNTARNIGKISVILTHEPNMEPNMVHEAVDDLARAYGQPIKIVLDGFHGGINWLYTIQFSSITSVGRLMKGLGLDNNKLITNGITASIKPAAVDYATSPPSTGVTTGSELHTSPTGRTTWRGDNVVTRSTPQPPPLTPIRTSGFATPLSDPSAYNYGPTSPFSPVNTSTLSTPGSRSSSLSGFGRRRVQSRLSQDVEIMAIESGTDVRTTLMIRNLPNRFGFADVKDILDETSKGHFDFLYVRMDFARSCNVGYAFVNFVRPEYIIPFHKARVHKPWPGVVTDKLVEVSYATIQGQDCLIQKFRNSSVMAEFTAFRPKLLYTVDSTDIPAGKTPGDEAPFPSSDNRQKFTRSVDNAKTIGLYPPRGTRSGHESRRPHTQFDRGTPGAMLDEAAYFQRTGHRGVAESSTNLAFDPFRTQVMNPTSYGPVARPASNFPPTVPRYVPTLPNIDAMPGAEAYYTPTHPSYEYHFNTSAAGYNEW